MDKDIFSFWQKYDSAPYHFPMEYPIWEKSWAQDMDSDGRRLFSKLQCNVIRDDANTIVGLIQYGITDFGFSDSGEISEAVHHNVIRALCFADADIGMRLLRTALAWFPAGERVHAFFHYFGMSACARHGKLHESNSHVQNLLLNNGFTVEHENIYYTKDLKDHKAHQNPITLRWSEPSLGGCREFTAVLQGKEVCWGQVHFLPQQEIAYLRWIYVDDKRQHTGIGTLVMDALFSHLCELGIRRFDTDTALSNKAAQHFYEKNSFDNMGITRSFYTK